MKYTGQLEQASSQTGVVQEEYFKNEEDLQRENYHQLRNHEINIRFLSRGMIIRVGCKEIAFETIVDGMQALDDYIANPYEETKQWLKILK
jgi:hypothetical protein